MQIFPRSSRFSRLFPYSVADAPHILFRKGGLRVNIHYFLGANSRRGFYSLYDSFPPGEGSFLHIIKGGPGNGKSGFMRRLAVAAEEKGLDVEYVLCSGDPDSLDGIYIPALHQAWCDGTAPHVTEPAFFAVDSDYVNLGSFCRLPISSPDGERIQQLNRTYKGLYRQAYALLSAAASVRDAVGNGSVPSWLVGYIGSILDQKLCQVPARPIPAARRFFSAVSCRGVLYLKEEILKLCKLIYAFDSHAPAALSLVVQEAKARGASLILSLDPLDPARLSAVLLPDCGLVFVDPGWELPGQQLIRLSDAPEQDAPQFAPLMEQAIHRLHQAKALHDEMEAVYRPYMDFAALDAFTALQIETQILA